MSIARKGRRGGTDKDREQEERREAEGPRAERKAPEGAAAKGKAPKGARGENGTEGRGGASPRGEGRERRREWTAGTH